MSGVPAGDSPESASSRGTEDADGPASHRRGPPVTDLVGKIAVVPLVPGSTAQPSRVSHSRSFHGFFTISSVFVTHFFISLEVS